MSKAKYQAQNYCIDITRNTPDSGPGQSTQS